MAQLPHNVAADVVEVDEVALLDDAGSDVLPCHSTACNNPASPQRVLFTVGVRSQNVVAGHDGSEAVDAEHQFAEAKHDGVWQMEDVHAERSRARPDVVDRRKGRREGAWFAMRRRRPPDGRGGLFQRLEGIVRRRRRHVFVRIVTWCRGRR
jgi:hypothetical protein